MKKMNEKGFAVTGILYTLLTLFLVLMLSLISVFTNRKTVLNNLKKGIVDGFPLYSNGTVVYFNPNTGEECSRDYTESQSATGVKSGCMKWYIFNDNEYSSTVDMILDHNTTSEVLWSSSGSSVNAPSDLLDGLKNDTDNWAGLYDRADKYTVDNGTSSYTVDYSGYKARLITVDEIARITGNLEWDSSDSSFRSFYFDSLGGTASATCMLGNTSGCKYGWLYDRTTDDCESYGCYNNGDSSIFGYWTVSPTAGYNTYAWRVYGQGRISDYTVNQAYYGIRPVITIPKDIVVDSTYLYKQYKYNYTGKVQEFEIPVNGIYKVELWGASGGKSSYTFTGANWEAYPSGAEIKGGLGAYTRGEINLSKGNKLYIVVGGAGEDGSRYSGTKLQSVGGYNGGGPGGSAFQVGGAGGGSTDIRTYYGSDILSFDSLKTRLMVAAGGAGGSNWKYAVTGGSAGGLQGYNGLLNENSATHTLATGGTQVSIGTKGNSAYDGAFGSGGSSQSGHGSGGGSGYYGGGGGGMTSGGVSSGAGGSSFISGHSGCDAIDESSTESEIVHTGQSTHYSGYKFNNTVMVDGTGYNWTTAKGNLTNMPTHDGTSTMTGNSGNGYAKITIIEVNK